MRADVPCQGCSGGQSWRLHKEPGEWGSRGLKCTPSLDFGKGTCGPGWDAQAGVRMSDSHLFLWSQHGGFPLPHCPSMEDSLPGLCKAE